MRMNDAKPGKNAFSLGCGIRHGKHGDGASISRCIRSLSRREFVWRRWPGTPRL